MLVQSTMVSAHLLIDLSEFVKCGPRTGQIRTGQIRTGQIRTGQISTGQISTGHDLRVHGSVYGGVTPLAQNHAEIFRRYSGVIAARLNAFPILVSNLPAESIHSGHG
jgi:hypothetical protein